QAAGARSLISPVARICRPGIKSDTCLMILGDQGIGKSSLLRMLFDPNEQKWFTDEIAELGSKDAAMQMRGVWCIELAELSALRAVELNRVKAFVTRTTDRFRPPYGRQIITTERQCVFVATSTDFEVLHNQTGNRRWLPFWAYCAKTREIWADRHQLWAEAVHRYRGGE